MKAIDQKVKKAVTRREVMKTGMTIAAGVGAFALYPPFTDTARATTGVDDNTVFPLLAAWLLITTNPSFAKMDPDSLSKQTGIPKTLITKAKSQVDNDTSGLYTNILKEFANLSAEYTGGPICPNLPGTLMPVAKAQLS